MTCWNCKRLFNIQSYLCIKNIRTMALELGWIKLGIESQLLWYCPLIFWDCDIPSLAVCEITCRMIHKCTHRHRTKSRMLWILTVTSFQGQAAQVIVCSLHSHFMITFMIRKSGQKNKRKYSISDESYVEANFSHTWTCFPNL